MSENNVIYISGNTYEHRDELHNIAIFDPVLKVFVAPISKMEHTKKLDLSLICTPSFQEDFIEPSNEIEWEIARTRSCLVLLNLKKNDLDLNISKCPDNEKEKIKDMKISLNKIEEDMSKEKKNLERFEEESKRGKTQELKFVSLKDFKQDWITSEPPKQPVLLTYTNKKDVVKPFMPKGIVSLLCAPGGTGKTRFITMLSACIASGIPFLDKFNVAEGIKGRVFIGMGEEPIEGMQRRFKSVFDYLNPDKEYINFESLKNNLVPYSFYGQNMALIDENGFPTKQYFEFINALKQSQQEGYDLIILDPISRFLGSKSEIDNDNGTKYMALMERITMEIKGNPTVLLTHHTGKGKNWKSQEASRGSSAISAAARWQMNMIGEADLADEKSNQEQINVLRDFVRADIVKRNDIPPLEKNLIMEFCKTHSVLIISDEEKINELKGTKGKDEPESNYSDRF